MAIKETNDSLQQTHTPFSIFPVSNIYISLYFSHLLKIKNQTVHCMKSIFNDNTLAQKNCLVKP